MKVKSLLPAALGLIISTSSYAATFTVTNTADSGPGSYRQAVLDANALAGADVIEFNIGTGAQTIALLANVDITSEIFVDGTSQPGYAGTPLISFTGTNMFRVNGGSNSTIQALNISGDTGGQGVSLINCSGVTIQDCDLSGNLYALRADGNNTNVQFINNDGSNASSNALFLAGGTNNGWTITGNNLTNAGGWGIHYASGTPASIDGNDVSDSRYGIYIISSGAFTLSPMGSGGPNENIYANHEQTIYFNACTGMNISNWDFTITTLAPNNTRTPFLITNCSNITIDNNNLSGMLYAMRADGNNSNIQFTNNNGSNAASNALFMTGGTNNGWTITGNNFTNAGGWGIHHASGTPTAIDGNNVSDSRYGIYMLSSGAFTLSPMGSGGPNENIYANHEQTLYFNACNGMDIINWDFTTTTLAPNNTRTPFLITNCANLIIDNNNLSGMLYAMRADGNNSNIQFTNNNGSNAASNALFMTGGTNNGWTITGNNLINAGGWGIHHASGTATAIDGNDVSDSRYGIYMLGSGAFTLSPMGSGGPNENTFANHEQTLYFNACNGMDIINWDFTTTTLAPNNTRTPFLITNCANLIIDNNNLSGMLYAMRADGNNSNIQFTNNNGSNAASNALFMTGGTNNGWTITGNNLINAGGWGIHHASGTPTSIDGNDVSDSRYGIYMLSSGAFTLSPMGSGGPNENTFANHEQTLYFNACNGMNISNWDFTATTLAPNNTRTPFLITNCANLVIDNNNLSGMLYGQRADGNNTNIQFTNNDCSNSASNALFLTGGTNNGWTITGNNCTNAGGWGIHHASGTPTDISNNDMSGSAYGLYMISSGAFTLGTNNYLNTANQGISMNACTSVTINNADVTAAGGTGILLTNSNSCNIDGTIACGRQYGIRLSGTCNNNNLTNSQIANSTADGIRLDGGTISNTTIDQSGFFNNTNDILDNGTGTSITNTTALASAPFCPCVTPADQTLAAAASPICTNTSTTIDLGSSENGVYYFLRDDSNDAIIDGPTDGTGSGISMNTGNISATTDYNVLATTTLGLDFDGANDYVLIPNESNFDFTTSMTVEFWVKTTNLALVDALVTKGDNSWRVHGNGAGTVMFAGNGAFPDINASTSIIDGVWHHVAAVYDGTNAMIYIDGNLEVSTPATGTIDNSAFQVAIGENLQASGRYFEGQMDDVRIWNIARSGAAISSNMTSCLSGGEAGLVAYYKFDDGVGSSTLADLTGNGNDGTLTNMNPATDWTIGSPGCGCEAEMTTIETVTVQDNAPTVATSPGNQTVSADAGTCAAIVAYTAPTFDDDCDGLGLAGTLSSGLASGASFPLGVNTVEYTYTDAAGQSITETFTITVTDNEDPLTPTLSTLTDECSVTATAPTTTDNCAGTITGTTTDPLTYSTQGTFTINWQFDDGNGNIISVPQTVTVDDVTPPVFAGMPTDQTILANNAGCTGIVTWTAPTATDNCGGAVTITSSHNSGDAFPLGTTTVTYTATDSEGNAINATFDITVNSDLGVTNVATIDVDCNGAATGSIDITVGGGTAPFTFDWDNDGTGDNDDTEDLTGLLAGTYNGVVTDANGCTDGGAVIINEPTAVVVTVDSQVDPSGCGLANGGANITATGGTAASGYTYLWTDGGSFNDTNEDQIALVAGSYTVVATDDNGCTGQATVNLSDPNGPSVTLNGASVLLTDCFGDTDGSIDIDVVLNGGATSSTFDWDNDGTGDNDDTEDLTGLGAGTYNVEVVDDNNCVATLAVTVNEPADIVVSAVVTDVTCYGDADGSVDVTATGGTVSGAYLYDWDNDGQGDNDDMEDAMGLGDSTLVLVVTDDNGCTDTTTYTVIEPDSVSGTFVLTHVSCYGLVDGAIDLTATGGDGSYTFLWDDAGASTTEDISGLGTATYTVTITDGNGCVGMVTDSIMQPDSLVLSAVATDELLGSDGTIDLTVNGGTAAYVFDWDNDGTGDNDDTEDLSALTAGTYVVVVTDANGCSDSLSVTVGSQVSVGDFETIDMSIYPNPNTGNFSIKLSKLTDNAVLRVLSADGRLVQQQAINNVITDVQLSTVERGTYMIQILTGDSTLTRTIIVQ